MTAIGLPALSDMALVASMLCALIALHLVSTADARKPWPNRLLGAFFGLVATQLFLQSLQLEQANAHFGPHRVALILAANPLVYFFFRLLRVHPARAGASDLLHFAPVACVPLLLQSGFANGLDILLFLSMSGYGSVYLLALRKGAGQFAERDDATRAFYWLRSFAGFCVLAAIIDLAIAVELWNGKSLGRSSLLPVAVLIVFAVSIALSYGAMGRRPAFDWLRRTAPDRAIPALPEDALGELAERVRRSIGEPGNYADENLSLTRFARRLVVPPRHVSLAVNRHLGMTFSELLNTTRIEAAKAVLDADEHRHLRIVDIACEVGFRSKSNFHRAFRQITGTTPRDYRAKPGSQ